MVYLSCWWWVNRRSGDETYGGGVVTLHNNPSTYVERGEQGSWHSPIIISVTELPPCSQSRGWGEQSLDSVPVKNYILITCIQNILSLKYYHLNYYPLHSAPGGLFWGSLWCVVCRCVWLHQLPHVIYLNAALRMFCRRVNNPDPDVNAAGWSMIRQWTQKISSNKISEGQCVDKQTIFRPKDRQETHSYGKTTTR